MNDQSQFGDQNPTQPNQGQPMAGGGAPVPPPAQPVPPVQPSPPAPQPVMPPPPAPAQNMAGMQGASAAGAQGAFDPTAGQQAAGQQGTDPTAPPPPPSPPANFQLGTLLPPVLKVKVPPHSLQFDDQKFLHLLAGSISLTKDEKARIIESIPKLKQSQVDELVRIFEEEREKFAELGAEHVPQLEKLAKQHYEDWVDIEQKQEQGNQANEDAAKAEELRKQLGL